MSNAHVLVHMFGVPPNRAYLAKVKVHISGPLALGLLLQQDQRPTLGDFSASNPECHTIHLDDDLGELFISPW